jgi:hypothetical protein
MILFSSIQWIFTITLPVPCSPIIGDTEQSRSAKLAWKSNKQIIQLRTKRQLIGYITEGNNNKKDYWEVWKAVNNVIFSNGNKEYLEVVESIKVLRWKWSLGKLKLHPCMFYEWTWDPCNCLTRCRFGVVFVHFQRYELQLCGSSAAAVLCSCCCLLCCVCLYFLSFDVPCCLVNWCIWWFRVLVPYVCGDCGFVVFVSFCIL